MIRIKAHKDYLVALESVAMTDIVLNMFIFFFISFSLLYTFNSSKVSKIDVKLPKASNVVSLEGREKIFLAVTRRGEYFMNDERVKEKALKRALQAKLKENPSMGIILKVDGAARFTVVVKALDVINELNIEKVSIATVKKE